MLGLEHVRSFFESIGTEAPAAALTALSWYTTYLMRKHTPVLYAAFFKWGKDGGKLQHVMGSAPGFIVAAVVAAMWVDPPPLETLSEGWARVKFAGIDAIKTVAAPLFHHFLKVLPNRYRGALGEPVTGPESRKRLVEDIE